MEIDEALAARGREQAATLAGAIEFVTSDASASDAYAGAVPARVVMACGVVGNVSDDDVHNIIEFVRRSPCCEASGERTFGIL